MRLWTEDMQVYKMGVSLLWEDIRLVIQKSRERPKEPVWMEVPQTGKKCSEFGLRIVQGCRVLLNRALYK